MGEVTLSRLLENMKVPEKRKPLTVENLRWLRRNLGISNVGHKDFMLANSLIHQLLIAKK